MWIYILFGLAVGVVSNYLMSVFHTWWLSRQIDTKGNQPGSEVTGHPGLPNRADIDQLTGARSWSLVGVVLTVFVGAILILFLQPLEVISFLISAAVPQAVFWLNRMRKTTA